jgi:hypothetical protein
LRRIKVRARITAILMIHFGGRGPACARIARRRAMNAMPTLHEGAARTVALIIAAGGCIDDCEMRALDGIHAFRNLGIDHDRFVELARTYAHELGSHLGETSWLRDCDRAYVDNVLHQVTDPDERLLTCRLAAAAMAAGGRVCDEQRMLYEHMLASWHMSVDPQAAQGEISPRRDEPPCT